MNPNIPAAANLWLYAGLCLLLLTYHVWLWLRLPPLPRQAPPAAWPASANALKVTFLVPAWNAAGHIAPFIDAYRLLTYPNKRLILCVGGDDDGFERAEACGGHDMSVVRQDPGDGKQGALARIYPLADGEIVYLTDIDCRPDDAAVNGLLAPLVRGDARAVTSGTRPLPEQQSIPLVQACWAAQRRSEPTVFSRVEGLQGCHCAFCREALEACGGFTTTAPSGTDYTLAEELKRCACSIFWVPGHPMPTEYPRTVRAYARQHSRWIRNVFIIGRQYGRTAFKMPGTIQALLLPHVLLLTLGLAAIGSHLAGVALALYIGHAVSKRMLNEKRAGVSPSLLGSVALLLGDQLAAARAGVQICLKRNPW